MKTMDTIMEQLTGNWILEDLSERIRHHDHEFTRIEKNYSKAVSCLREHTPGDLPISLEEYLNACRKDVVANILYAAYLGYSVNLENFRSSYTISFERMDFTDYIRDHLIGHFPIHYECERIKASFRNALPEKYRPLTNSIDSYFISLDVTGTKLAHYAGYAISNRLLPMMVPGYREDVVQTMNYSRELKKYVGFLPL